MSGIMFEWDERKRLSTLTKHGIDFLDAVLIFDGYPLVLGTAYEGEERFIAIAPMNGKMIAVVFTLREETIRIVTSRRARRNERRAYYANLDG